MARVYVLRETSLDETPDLTHFTLWFQWCRYLYDDEKEEYGYRFIWRRPKDDGGGLQAARGQARIPSLAVIERLIAKARKAGWGHFDGDDHPNALDVVWASIDDVLDPKLEDDHRGTQVRAFIEVAAGSLYNIDETIGNVPTGGAFTGGSIFKDTRQLYNELDTASRELLKAHFRDAERDSSLNH